jgi:acetyltransferase-like isoleucine patch superfamily enzyme
MSEPVVHGQYTAARYVQFSGSNRLRALQSFLGVLTWPLVWPLAMLARSSDIVFRTLSEAFAMVPYFPGVILRYEFYRFALRGGCGRNVLIEFGTVFIYPDVSIGNNVLIGRYNIIHHCDFGDYVLTGERCTFLSGARQHSFERTDVPIALQGGQKKRIKVGGDCWIGAHVVVLEDIGPGCVVGSGSVVVKAVPERAVVVGNPARVLRRRGGNAAGAR